MSQLYLIFYNLLCIIQNTTFGGIQGFTRPPSTPWFDDNGMFAGIVHQERDWTYTLIQGAGHLVAQQQPEKVRSLSLLLILIICFSVREYSC